MKLLNVRMKNLVVKEKLIMYILLHHWILLGCGPLFFISCDDMEDKQKFVADTGVNEPTQLYILSEGLYNNNNSTLATYDLTTKTLVTDFFLAANKRGLGDTGNDMGIYGSKLYVVMNVSSQIEVLDTKTGKSLAQIAMFNDAGAAREPRNIEFYNGKAYVCSFDGTVAKIDTASLKVEALVQCGKNPDGICVANNKLYVSNSGGLNFPNYDNTVSVIDIERFSETKKIIVASNPGKIKADNHGNVYVISNGDFSANSSKFQLINSETDLLENTFDDIDPVNFTIFNDSIYVYSINYLTKKSSLKIFNSKQKKIVSNNFVSDNTIILTPYSINVNPANGDVYITDVKSYTVYGDVLCFDKSGKLKFKIREIGLNPNKVIFN